MVHPRAVEKLNEALRDLMSVSRRKSEDDENAGVDEKERQRRQAYTRFARTVICEAIFRGKTYEGVC
jgi:hypothetical protein